MVVCLLTNTILPESKIQTSLKTFGGKRVARVLIFYLGFKNGKSEIQAVRFDKDQFTASEAKEWLDKKDMNYSEFEEANLKESLTFERYLL